jgi:hypothetical protein
MFDFFIACINLNLSNLWDVKSIIIFNKLKEAAVYKNKEGRGDKI